jgi:HEAT repeat protein
MNSLPRLMGQRLLDSRSDGDRERAAAAAAGLADTGADDAIRLLEPRLRDSARDVRAAAALSLGRVLASQQSIDELAAGLRRAEKEPARRLALAAALVVKAGNEPEPVLAALAAIGEDGPPLGALMARVTHGLISSSADAFTFFRWMAP